MRTKIRVIRKFKISDESIRDMDDKTQAMSISQPKVDSKTAQ